MTLQVPAHQAGLADHHWLRDILIVGIAAILMIGAVWFVSTVRIVPVSTTTEAQSLVDFRAGERASWVMANTTEQDSLIQFRADERP